MSLHKQVEKSNMYLERCVLHEREREKEREIERKIKVQNARIVATILSYHSVPHQCSEKIMEFSNSI